ncbi:hypothetical protein LZ32DRAFT_268356 [Colletotrichum eremochloae]|nr:hypothetical protein LZ32DRAFT_268356 [Colletotrichum eremochloae]
MPRIDKAHVACSGSGFFETISPLPHHSPVLSACGAGSAAFWSQDTVLHYCTETALSSSGSMMANLDRNAGTNARQVCGIARSAEPQRSFQAPLLHERHYAWHGSDDDMDSFGGHRGTVLISTPMTLRSRYLLSSNTSSGRFSGERSTRPTPRNEATRAFCLPHNPRNGSGGVRSRIGRR